MMALLGSYFFSLLCVLFSASALYGMYAGFLTAGSQDHFIGIFVYSIMSAFLSAFIASFLHKIHQGRLEGNGHN